MGRRREDGEVKERRREESNNKRSDGRSEKPADRVLDARPGRRTLLAVHVEHKPHCTRTPGERLQKVVCNK